MIKQSKTVIFFGSGPLAAASLKLLAKDFTIEAVITKSTPPQHKGRVPVAQLAKNLNVKTYSIDNKAHLDNLIDSVSFDSEVAILVDFGIIVSQKVIDYFQKGIINSHFSILPQWRGADPISFALLSGQKSTGVSLMLLVEAMDEGPLLAYSEIDIGPEITNPILSDKLVELSHQLLKEFVPPYLVGKVKAQPQTITGRDVSYSRKLTKQDGLIDWNKSATKIEQEIRAFIEWPKSRTMISNIDVILTKAHVRPMTHTQPGKFEVENNELLFMECGKDSLYIDKLKPSGKPEMTIGAFLAGYSKRLT